VGWRLRPMRGGRRMGRGMWASIGKSQIFFIFSFKHINL